MYRVSWKFWKTTQLSLEIAQVIIRCRIMWGFFSKICFFYSCLTRFHCQKVPEQLRFSPLVVRTSATMSPALLLSVTQLQHDYCICISGRFVILMWLKCSNLLFELQLKCLLLPVILLSDWIWKLGNNLMNHAWCIIMHALWLNNLNR